MYVISSWPHIDTSPANIDKTLKIHPYWCHVIIHINIHVGNFHWGPKVSVIKPLSKQIYNQVIQGNYMYLFDCMDTGNFYQGALLSIINFFTDSSIHMKNYYSYVTLIFNWWFSYNS